ncbi:unnamed protein product [Fraxinus pennsylvanica]|uniref:Protein kinase domain-containing protein n=1 Tax=Fraxinus pennsylvanica TaxID=56036 RepID=A0AAD1ZRR5_9LAMI|nr:unnamed protein product [Fraxinus pennsylvanica]
MFIVFVGSSRSQSKDWKFWENMRCFPFSNGTKNDEQKTSKYTPVPSSTSSVLTDPDTKKSGSEYNSQNISDISTESSVRFSFKSLSQRPSKLRVFTFAELKTATKNFSRTLMIGEGGFGPGHKEWVTEVNVLGIVEHPNLVKLIGYCAEDDEIGMQRLLIYEYLSKRSVQAHLSSRFQASLPWITRLKIAQDAARGLAYLHEGMEFQIIFRDFKSSNILLDDQWNAKLSDFGFARLGPLDGIGYVSTAVVGTVGYAAPEYIQTGHLTVKSDVWSYGVFLYELISGRQPLDRNRPKNEQKLLDWARPHLANSKRFEQILDSRLDGKYSLKSAQKLAAIANRCLVRHPKKRPRMSEVLEMVNQIVEGNDNRSPEAAIENSPQRDNEKSMAQSLLKWRFVDRVIGENKWLCWRSWRPKPVRTN